jgi:hypothetical protein
MKKLVGILFVLLFMLSPAKAQLTQAQVNADINSMLTSCGNGCNTAATLRALLDIMAQATFFPATVQMLNAAPQPIVNLQTVVPTNGFYISGSGAIFNTCPLTYTGNCTSGVMAQTYAAQYLKSTAVRDSTIAEYMVVNDCDLNSGKGGAGVGTFNDNKVCQYNNVTTGANAGIATWVQANNLVIGANDNNPIPIGRVPAKFNTELDITNNSPDCAVAVKNCYALLLSGLVTNPVTAYVAISAGAGSSLGHPGSHFGILVNGTGQFLADNVDIENSGNAAYGICNGCLTPQTHSAAGFRDVSTTINGFEFGGTYSGAAIHLLAGAKICFEVTNAVCQAWNGTAIASTFTVAAPYLQTGPNTIGSLAACTGPLAGLRSSVTNGVAAPALGSTVSTTGAVWQPVSCNGTNWIYG